MLKENKERSSLKAKGICLLLIVVHVGLFAQEKEDSHVNDLVRKLEKKLPASKFHDDLAFANIPSLIFNLTKKTEKKYLGKQPESTRETVVQEYLKDKELPTFPRAILKIRELQRRLNFYPAHPQRSYYFPSRTAHDDGDNILWHPKEDTILSCRGGMTHVWEISKKPGQKYVKTFIDDNGNFTVQALSHDGQYLATGGESNVPIRIWNLKQNKVEGAVKTLAHCDDISSIDFSSDDKQLAIAQGKNICIWSWTHNQPENPVTTVLAAADRITALRFINQSFLISGSDDGTIYKWCINVNTPLSKCKLNNRITSLHVKNNDNTLVCSTTNQIYILHLLTWDILRELPLDNSQYAQTRFNHKTNQISVYEKTWGSKSPVHIWKNGDIKKKDPLKIESNNPGSKILDCTFSPDGSHIALLTTGNEVEICEIPPDYSSIAAYTFDKLFGLLAKNIKENSTQKITNLKTFCSNTFADLDDNHKKRILCRLRSQKETWDIAEELEKQERIQQQLKSDQDLKDFAII